MKTHNMYLIWFSCIGSLWSLACAERMEKWEPLVQVFFQHMASCCTHSQVY